MDALNTSSHDIVKEKEELDSICKELGLLDIKYLPSPKEKSGNISDLTKHATLMLKAYKRYKDGDKTAPVKKIFVD